MTPPAANPGAKMMYLIKRKPTTSREELVAHWFANHMPLVIQGQKDQEAAGKRHATRYIASLFDADERGERPWDGVAQLWWDAALPKPKSAYGTTPTDSFQERAEPYVPWGTTEYIAIDGSDQIPVEPLTLNAPFPCTRSGFLKMTYLVKAKEGTDFAAFFDYWLDAHVSNVQEAMKQVGGFRYVVSHSIDPESELYAGMAELYFRDAAELAAFGNTIQPDDMGQWSDPAGTVALASTTEMIGLP
ncbi:MAG TPA: EthD domain-containing protein [Dehalococcoidia bacterium]|nr:EthD domain-containing protein [Dehalococcoidia bacterium]